MIRINLIAAAREPKKRPSVLAAQKVTIAGSAIIAAALLFLGWRYVSMRNTSAGLESKIKAAQLQAQQLKSVLADVKDFEGRKQQLQQRVALIEELRQGQTGPVRMLDEVSRAVPERLWLTALTQEASGLKLEGRTTSLNALSDFVANLENSGFFARPVEILDSQTESAQQSTDVQRFTVKAQFQTAGTTAGPAGTTTGTAPAARPTSGTPSAR